MSVHCAHFEIYKDTSGNWRWRLRARNGRIVAASAEGYASKRNVKAAVATTVLVMSDAVAHPPTIQQCGG